MESIEKLKELKMYKIEYSLAMDVMDYHRAEMLSNLIDSLEEEIEKEQNNTERIIIDDIDVTDCPDLDCSLLTCDLCLAGCHKCEGIYCSFKKFAREKKTINEKLKENVKLRERLEEESQAKRRVYRKLSEVFKRYNLNAFTPDSVNLYHIIKELL